MYVLYIYIYIYRCMSYIYIYIYIYIYRGGPMRNPPLHLRRNPLANAEPRKGANGVGTNGVTAFLFKCFLTEGPLGYSR